MKKNYNCSDVAAKLDVNPCDIYVSGLMNDLNASLIEETNAIFYTALRKKGYDFSDDFQLEKFVKENCHAVYNEKQNVTTYYVKGKPFLMRKLNNIFDFDIKSDSVKETITSTVGTFYYL
ncbi:hypothetical protein FHS04_001243 [Mesoflavibacter sabulilitoris]|uniref:Uncharacterized protein n=1 Tax=Mesoflavibacter zeaxanthinifaciens subsp. sabulilitoris TaxID=1520893 RepID=A0A2T1NAH3_9FLAO|nr:hypothetical protein [Mesoflavibacter zeaxanthinifaciens]MBB3123740.1 hypothetical protein [Mesoflavibacter zeaxanthinifaciens subsp. sabulilitoris]PSG89139.1 hypothetical protein C7H61_09280 [Mesoflavibacter zeaxanthinifaciens subsp. sabulilitoris]